MQKFKILITSFLLFLCPCLIHGENMQKKVVLITGCSSGIGFHTAAHLSDAGYKVYAGLLDVSQDGNLLKQATRQPENLIPITLDVTSAQHIKDAMDQIMLQDGHIDILINNAAYGLFGPVDSCTMQEIKQQFEVNLFGAIELTHAVIPHFRKQASGRIICISSTRAFNTSSIQGVYSATKSALEAIAGSWASTLFPWNIHVTLVEPDATDTAFPKNMVCGSFYKDTDTPYTHILENALELVHDWHGDPQKTQNPQEIALLIEQIIEAESPNLRVQTNKIGKERITKLMNDPTGHIWLQAEKELVRNLSQSSKDMTYSSANR